MEYFVSDGYYPNGSSRPWRQVAIVDVMKNTKWIKVRYTDTGEELTCPKYAVYERGVKC